MQVLLRSCMEILDVALWQPSTQVQFYTALVMAILGCSLVVYAFSTRAAASGPSIFGAFSTSIIGLVLMLVAAGAVKIYVLPEIDRNVRPYLLPGGAILSALIIVVPLLSMRFKMKYLTALAAWLIGLVASAALVYAVSIGFEAAKSGGMNAGRERQRKTTIDRILQDVSGQ